MLAIIYLVLFELCGVMIVHCLAPQKSPVVRVWIGLALGLLLMMWLPALCAFLWRFSLVAHWWAMVLLVLLTGGAYFLRDQRPFRKLDEKDRALLKALLFTALPLTALGGALQWTHTLMPAVDAYGNWGLHVGQSTYGDLPLHLAIASSLRDAPFPPEYSILPGAMLSYPFLADSLSTTFLLMGFSLRWAILLPGLIMTALTFAGYVILAGRMADSRKGAILAALLFFLNGGLGFMYLVDMQGRVLGVSGGHVLRILDENGNVLFTQLPGEKIQIVNLYGQVLNDSWKNELQGVSGLWERIQAVLNGWYQTPVNHAEFGTYNLRWSNVIVDMMVPQRTTLAGWTMVLPCIYLLYDAVRPEEPFGMRILPDADGPTAVFRRRELDVRQLALLGVMAGALPMVNTHCFLALGLLSAGWMAWDVLRSRHQRKEALLFWGLYGGIAVALSAPQLFTWTFRQAAGSDHFLQFRFNWVNGDWGMEDLYLWFWIKNVGLPFILILLAILEKNEKRRFLACGAFVIFLAAEFIQFQPNPYDNNKLFYIWYMVCAVIAADYGLELLSRLRGTRARYVIAVLSVFVFFASGSLSIARELKSDYQMFSREDVEAAEFIEENIPQHATFLTGTGHINLVSSLAGRTIVCGPDTWLVFHGFSIAQRMYEISAFYADPAGNLALLDQYGVDYILVSDKENAMYPNLPALESLFPRVYESASGTIRIYAVPKE